MCNAIIEAMSTVTSPASLVELPKIAQERHERLAARTAKIGVIGLGYVGLPLSLLLSEPGFKVTGFHIAAKKVPDLEAGRPAVFRGAHTASRATPNQGLRATTQC